MASQELEIEIAPDGKVTMRTQGIKGPACMDWADLLTQIVGREEFRERTPEFYEEITSETNTTVDIRQRR